LAASSTCTITVIFTPTATGAVTGSVIVTGGVTVTGSPVALNGTGIAPPVLTTLGVLDNFNRVNANTLGANWSQVTLFGSASIKILSNQAVCSGITCALTGYGYWNAATFGSKQGAAITFINAPSNGSSLFLKVTGGSTTLGLNGIRVRYNAGSVIVETTTNSGGSFTPSGTFTASIVAGQTLAAVVDSTGLVNVWVNSTFVGSAQLPNNALWTTGGGRIGLQLPTANLAVDNFSGGNVP
jgi:hypothetical protein